MKAKINSVNYVNLINDEIEQISIETCRLDQRDVLINVEGRKFRVNADCLRLAIYNAENSF